MSGCVGVIANDAARYTQFFFSLNALRGPEGTSVEWGVGSDRIRGRENLIHRAQRLEAEWLLFLDDDQAFAPDLLERLLAREKEVVAALYLQRMQPFHPVAYSERDENGLYAPILLGEYSGDELITVRAAGTGGMLVRMEVFRAIDRRWPREPIFEHGVASEDMLFCEKAAAVGYAVHCDLGARMGHMTPTAIWPHSEDGDWSVGFQTAGQTMLAPIQEDVLV